MGNQTFSLFYFVISEQNRIFAENNHSTFTMKHLFTLILLLSITATGYCQKVFSTDNSYQADVKVYVVDYEYRADLVVYRAEYRYEAEQNKNTGIWFFTEYAYQADKKIYFTDYEYQADLKVLFTDSKYRAGWKNNKKKALMY